MMSVSSAWVIACGRAVKAPRLVRAAILACTRLSSAEVVPMWAAMVSATMALSLVSVTMVVSAVSTHASP